ncbi:topoisomerase IV [Clostridium botulinum]|nr:topoisomerase IV [Clostridium botulinum]
MSKIREFTIETNMVKNYMGYGMYVITDRALPKVEDGFLPVQRKILYAMKQSGFTYNKDYAKTLDIIGSTTPYYVHGDSSLAGAMSLLVDTNETQRVPLIEGHGNFSNVLSSGGYSAPRYTSARLSKFAVDNLFQGIDKQCVKMVGEIDHKEPLFLPTRYPNILTVNLMGIAVGMSCNFHGYSLKDVCDYTSKYILDKTLIAGDYLIPDFNDTCEIIYNEKEIKAIADTGKGSIKVRGKYVVKEAPQGFTLTVYVPYGTTATALTEEIISKIDKFKEIIDVRNGTGFNREKQKEEYVVDIDIKRNTDIESLMTKLYKYTQCETSVSYNMNCLINFIPKVRGVNEILDSWIATREECVKKSLEFDFNKQSEKLHILYGYKKIFLDIDKTIEIIRNTKEENLINKSLIEHFNIDEFQAECISNLKLKSINKKYIANQIKVINNLEKEVEDLKYKINHKEEIDKIIISELSVISNEYSCPRKTKIIQPSEIKEVSKIDLIEDYNCRLTYTKQGYIKKHLKKSDNHKIKDGDVILDNIEINNKQTLLIFTDKANRYSIPVHELNTYTPSQLGDYVYNITNMDKNENIIKIVSIPKDSKGYMVFVYNNGKIAKIDINSYLSNNKKLQNCYNTDNDLIAIDYIEKYTDVLLISSEGKSLILNTERINSKSSRNSQGVTGIKLNEGYNCIGSIIGINKEYNFRLITEKGKSKEFMLDDVVSQDNDKRLFDYLYSRPSNMGNFLLNTRKNNDKITKFELL